MQTEHHSFLSEEERINIFFKYGEKKPSRDEDLTVNQVCEDRRLSICGILCEVIGPLTLYHNS